MRSLLFLMLTVSPAAAIAQGMVQAVPGTTDADRLGATMRRVAANPRDVDALVTAGEQSLKVEDLSGAASLFARAEKIDPRNGRVKAGMASILVRSERPGEALRYFDQATAFGLDPRRFAADRGLAYDLIGEQERAQRDYKLALQAGGDDETIRRYALSLGISGKREEALKQLDPLLGKTDRAAWRARAFVLAMGGDQAAAERIASTMMPGGMAQGLLPFFRRLPTLPAADRAFAVHFGEVRASPERLADARLAPALTPLTPEPRPVALAAATMPTSMSRSDRRRDRRSKRERPGRTPIEQVAAAPATASSSTRPVQVAALSSPSVPAQVLPAPVRSNPSPTRPAPERTVTQAASSLTVAPGFTTPFAPAARDSARAAPGVPTGPSTAPSTSPGSASPLVSSSRVGTGAVPGTGTSSATPLPPTNTARAQSTPSVPSAGVTSAMPVTSLPAAAAPPAALAGVSTLSPSPAASTSPTTVADNPPASSSIAASAQPAVSVASAPVATTNADPTFGTDPVTSVAAPAVAAAGPPPARIGEDSVLARIIASLSIPAEELGVTDPARPVSAPLNDGAARTAEAARIKTARDAEVTAAAERLAARARTADRRALAVKTAADKKLAAEKKAAADKLAEERRIARTNPPRIWVQVAGGANERDLAKAWSAAKAKAPKALGGRSGYTTPLRATNRVLTGPFKTDAEARSFVNQLSKQGVSAFTFNSDQGQSVSRLSAK